MSRDRFIDIYTENVSRLVEFILNDVGIERLQKHDRRKQLGWIMDFVEEDGYIKIEEIKSCDKDIMIFGAGVDGERLYKSVVNYVNIRLFIDNGVYRSKTFHGIKIVGLSKLKNNRCEEIIIIASWKYNKQMSEQMTDAGYVLGEDFFVWDGVGEDKSIDFGDSNIKKFIDLNNRLWQDYKIEGSDRKILIPYINVCEITYAQWSYCANYLAKKYDASIYCVGGVGDVFNENVLQIYDSFNALGRIDETLSKDMMDEVERIFGDIWPNIKEKKDLKNIIIYGEKFGVDFLRDYLRNIEPILIINDLTLERQLKQMIGYVVFWHDYFKKNHTDIKAVILWDGLYSREGIMRKIAYGYNIPTYSIVNTTGFKWNYDVEFDFEYYAKYYEMLSKEEKKKGIEWARDKLSCHILGDTEHMQMVSKSTFGERVDNERILANNKKLKVMICPHYSEDDAFPYGDAMLFEDPWDWLEYLGRLSNETSYDWYLKPHPIEKEYGDKLINKFTKKYPNIKLLPKYISPIQLKNEGMEYALTIHGSIGYEYPLIGIDVINAGYNPHIAFDFSITPETRGDYDALLRSLDRTKRLEVDNNQIYAFYCIHFLYLTPRKPDMRKDFFVDERLRDLRGLIDSKTEYTTELFSIYTDEITEQRHKELKKTYKSLFERMDAYKKGVFNKKIVY